MTLIHQLRAATAPEHQALEQLSRGERLKQADGFSWDDYRSWMLWQAISHALLEHLLREESANISRGDYQYAFRAEVLQKDLKLLRLPMVGPDQLAHLARPNITNELDYLAVCYVLEGSSLGGKHIYRMLQQQTALKAVQEFHFYQFQAQQGAKQWRQLLPKLQQVTANAATAVECARRCFRLFAEVWRLVNQQAANQSAERPIRSLLK